MKLFATIALAVASLSAQAADVIGSVNTSWAIGQSHKIEILAFNDPAVPNSVCFLSRPVKGGISGALGLATETSDSSIACRGVGPVAWNPNMKDNERVFNESRSILFKTLHVVRMLDRQRKVYVYLSYTDKLIDGSPKHSLSVVPAN